MWHQFAVASSRALRIAGTGLSFFVMGVGGLVLGLFVGVVLRVIIPDREAHAKVARLVVSRAFRLFVWFMSGVGVLRWSMQGLEHWNRGHGCLVVANHPTLIDVVFLLAQFRGADCIVKASVLRNPTWGALVRSADYLSNENVELLLDEAVRRLRSGRTVIVFPEGTRTVPGQPLAFGSVAGAIAVRAGCQILPVVITCTPPTLYKSLPWYRVPATRANFLLRACSPIQVPEVIGQPAELRRAAHALTGQLVAVFSRELWSANIATHNQAVQPVANPVR